MLKTLRTLIGVGVIGPIAGIGRYIVNPAGLSCGIAAFLASMFLYSYSMGASLLIASGYHFLASLVKTAVHAYESYMTCAKLVFIRTNHPTMRNYNPEYLRDSINYSLGGNPFGNSILYGFNKANQVAGYRYYDNKSYQKALELTSSPHLKEGDFYC